MSIKLDTPTSYSTLKLVREQEHLFFLKLCGKVQEGLKLCSVWKRCYCYGVGIRVKDRLADTGNIPCVLHVSSSYFSEIS